MEWTEQYCYTSVKLSSVRRCRSRYAFIGQILQLQLAVVNEQLSIMTTTYRVLCRRREALSYDWSRRFTTQQFQQQFQSHTEERVSATCRQKIHV